MDFLFSPSPPYLRRGASLHGASRATSLWEIISILQTFGASDQRVVEVVDGLSGQGYLRQPVTGRQACQA